MRDRGCACESVCCRKMIGLPYLGTIPKPRIVLTNMSMLEIRARFDKFATMFPDEIHEFSAELKTMKSLVSNIFENDLRAINRIIIKKRLNIHIDRTKLENETNLILTSLYEELPKTKSQVIQFLVADLFICKTVIIQIIHYIVTGLLPRIQQALKDYEERKNNHLVEVFHEFIGYCKNIIRIISEYLLFQKKIEDKFQNIKGPRVLALPDRNKLRDGVQECLAYATNG